MLELLATEFPQYNLFPAVVFLLVVILERFPFSYFFSEFKILISVQCIRKFFHIYS